MRLFVAVNFPEPLRSKMMGCTETLREMDLPLRWLDAGQLHLTMKFLGEVPEERVEAAGDVLDRVAGSYRPFSFTFGGIGAFPTLRDPRVVWIGVDPVLELRSAKHDLEHAYTELGIDAETRAFQPHVTMARVRGGSRAGDFRKLEHTAGEISLDATLRVETFDLVRSHLKPGGAEYEVIHASLLGAGGGD